jgi:hypothetical protein
MARKKSTPRKAARVKDLSARKAAKIKGGLLLGSPQLLSSRFEGDGQPPNDLRKTK